MTSKASKRHFYLIASAFYMIPFMLAFILYQFRESNEVINYLLENYSFHIAAAFVLGVIPPMVLYIRVGLKRVNNKSTE